ncbi:efflux RND transporter periplasmic adaptor subunit [Martelella sp. HB161492]|uniref:efflux RND transporter periplasmic adaptor subunit n=1 Tax=Martelella sp. HB161492 TaxID=2720726 RepID=UPI00158FE3C3|nr:efflux RND transporter periplasmic adaptor subunit [Martelella sp. HB161492]
MTPKRLAFLASAIVIIGGGGYGLWTLALQPDPQPLATAIASRGDIEQTVLATGQLKPAHLVAVGAQVSGRITAVHVKPGDTVSKGDLIAEIDSVTQQNELRTAEATLADAKAQLAEKQAKLVVNRQSLDRYRELLMNNTGRRSDVEQAEADLNVTTAQIEAAEAAIIRAEVGVDTARANLGYTEITAPSDGTVLAIVSQEGQTVNAAQSAPTIVVLGQLGQMVVRTEISEADITRVSAGLPVYFNVIGDPDRIYRTTLDTIEPAPESIRRDSSFSGSDGSDSSSSSNTSNAVYYNGIFTVPNPDGRLRTYMTAEVHIVLGAAEDVLTIPAVALGAADDDGSYTVRVIDDDGTIRPVRVTIGLNDKVTAEVLSGLKEGERVVTELPVPDDGDGQPDGWVSAGPLPPGA